MTNFNIANTQSTSSTTTAARRYPPNNPTSSSSSSSSNPNSTNPMRGGEHRAGGGGGPSSSNALPSSTATTTTTAIRVNSRSRIPAYLTSSPMSYLLHEDKPLPTSWNGKDSNAMLELSRGNMRVAYIGSGKSDGDAASVRANYPMPPQCGIFYFEVEIVAKGRDGYIGVGFCGPSVSTQRLPGWEPSSWGYHGDDGHSFACSGTGRNYGPTYTTGDTIGCGVDFGSMTSFFTKNGISLGNAFKDLKGTLFPALGLRTPGEIVEVNFGASPFKFDIAHYYQEEKSKLWAAINTIYLPPPISSLPSAPTSATRNPPGASLDDSTSAMEVSQASNFSSMSASTTRRVTATIVPAATSSPSSLPQLPFQPPTKYKSSISNDLILQYLVHHGFAETAGSFHAAAYSGQQSAYIPLPTSALEPPRNPPQPPQPVPVPRLDDSSRMADRAKIRDAVLSGDLDVATDLTTVLFPKAWVVDRDVGFRVRLRKFMEVIREAVPPPAALPTSVTMTMEEDDDEDDLFEDVREEPEVDADEMEVDGDSNNANGAGGKGANGHRHNREEQQQVRDSKGKQRVGGVSSNNLNHSGDESSTRGGSGTAGGGGGGRGKWRHVIRLGQELNAEFGEDPDRIEALQEAFSLIAYQNPYDSPMGHLLDPSAREPVANALNSAILVSLGQPPVPALETIYRQSNAVIASLVNAGVGPAAFINVEKDCLDVD